MIELVVLLAPVRGLGGSAQPPGRKVPAGACAGGSRLTPGGGQVMPRSRRLLDALSASQLPIFGSNCAFMARRSATPHTFIFRDLCRFFFRDTVDA